MKCSSMQDVFVVNVVWMVYAYERFYSDYLLSEIISNGMEYWLTDNRSIKKTNIQSNSNYDIIAK